MKKGVKRSEKGQSEIITTVLIILLVLAAVVILWVVIRNVISDKSDDISIDKFAIDMEIQKAYISQDGKSMTVTVHRNAGKGNLSLMAFILIDSSQSEYRGNRSDPPKESETITYEMNSTIFNPQISDFSDINKVLIRYGYKNSNGEMILSDIVDAFGPGKDPYSNNNDPSDDFSDEDNQENATKKDCNWGTRTCGYAINPDECGDYKGCSFGSCVNYVCVLSGEVYQKYIGLTKAFNSEAFLGYPDNSFKNKKIKFTSGILLNQCHNIEQSQSGGIPSLTDYPWIRIITDVSLLNTIVDNGDGDTFQIRDIC